MMAKRQRQQQPRDDNEGLGFCDYTIAEWDERAMSENQGED